MQELLLVNASVTIAADGTGSVGIGPNQPFERWTISNVAVTCTGVTVGVDSPEFLLYRGTADNANFIGGSYSGDRDNDNQIDEELHQGEFFTGVWIGAPVGATATLVVRGKRIYDR